jgi:hypothetical protein
MQLAPEHVQAVPAAWCGLIACSNVRCTTYACCGAAKRQSSNDGCLSVTMIMHVKWQHALTASPAYNMTALSPAHMPARFRLSGMSLVSSLQTPGLLAASWATLVCLNTPTVGPVVMPRR